MPFQSSLIVRGVITACDFWSYHTVGFIDPIPHPNTFVAVRDNAETLTIRGSTACGVENARSAVTMQYLQTLLDDALLKFMF